MPTIEELISGLQTRILEIEQSIDEIKKRPATPDRTAEIESLKKEISELRKDLAEANKIKKTPPVEPPKGEEDVSLGHFS